MLGIPIPKSRNWEGKRNHNFQISPKPSKAHSSRFQGPGFLGDEAEGKLACTERRKWKISENKLLIFICC